MTELSERGLHLARVLADRRGLVRVPVAPAEVPMPRTLHADLADVTRLPVGVREALVEQAEAIVAGRFPLLGYAPLPYGAHPDWQLDAVSGRRADQHEHWSRVPYLDAAVVGDHKVTWELNRSQWALRLAQAWRLTGDARFAARAVALIDAWIVDNAGRRGMNWTSALELAFRTMAWTGALPWLADAPGVDGAFVRRVATSLLAQVTHLEWNLSTWFSPNTHLTGEALALLMTGAAWPTLPGARRRRDLGWRILCEQATRQHRPDGSYFEQTTWYQAYTVDFYVTAMRWAALDGLAIPAVVHTRTAAAARALRAFARPDGTIPLVADDDGGHLLPLAPIDPADVTDVLARAALHFADPSLTISGSAGRWALPWSDGAGALDRLDEIERDPRADAGRNGAILRDGGWVVLTERGSAPTQDHHLLLDAGAHGGLSNGHSHADALAFTLAVRGVPLVIDPGTGAYVGERRDRYRSTRVHATVTVDALDSSVQGTAFRWRTATDARLAGAALAPAASWADAWHDGYARLADPVRHRRTIGRLARRYWIMLDTLTCATPHAIALALPAPAGADATAAPDGRAAAIARDGVTLRVAGDGALTWGVERRTVSPAYGAEVEAPALVATGTIAGTTTVLTVLGADDECGSPVVERTGARRWHVTTAAGTDTIVAPLGETIDVGGASFDGTWGALLGEGSGAHLIVAGVGTLVAGDMRVVLGADDTRCLRRAGDRWVAADDEGR